MNESNQYAKRLNQGLYEVQEGRYVACQCWYSLEKDGLREQENPECVIHGKDAQTGS